MINRRISHLVSKKKKKWQSPYFSPHKLLTDPVLSHFLRQTFFKNSFSWYFPFSCSNRFVFDGHVSVSRKKLAFDSEEPGTELQLRGFLIFSLSFSVAVRKFWINWTENRYVENRRIYLTTIGLLGLPRVCWGVSYQRQHSIIRRCFCIICRSISSVSALDMDGRMEEFLQNCSSVNTKRVSIGGTQRSEHK